MITLAKANLGSLLLILYMLGLSVALFDSLPDSLPMQFDLTGNPGNYQPKLFAAALLPASFIVLIFTVKGLLQLSPNAYSMPNSKNAVNTILFGSGLLLAASHTAILVYANDTSYQFRTLSIGLALFMVVVGNVWGKTERNFFLGLRLPWTIASEANWKVTHRLAGKLMVIAGCCLLLVSPLTDNLIPALALLCLTVAVPVVYSYWYYAKNENDQQI